MGAPRRCVLSEVRARMTWSEEARAALQARLFAQNQFAVKLGLDAMREALARSGNPERHSPAALVAGTNGKGTCAACLHGILVAHGEVSGLYTSPHLSRLAERFRVQGRAIDDERLWDELERVLIEHGDGPHRLTFFELTTLMAARLFCAAGTTCDVYEIGLGGRLDAVNAIEPAVSIITTIGYDHQQYLGESLTEIAGEKAGIVRPGVPVIIGAQEYDEALDALRARVGAQGVYEGEDFGVDEAGIWDRHGRYAWAADVQLAPLQRRHAAAAWLAARVLLGARFDAARAMAGIEAVRWPGRLQRLEWSGARFLLDAAHNRDGARALFEALVASGERVGAVVCGGMGDKALDQMFAPLDGLGAPVYGALIANPRAADAARLGAVIPAAVYRGAGPTRWALEQAVQVTGNGLVLVYGSIYLLGEVFEVMGRGEEPGRVLAL